MSDTKAVKAPLTPKKDKKPHVVKLKVFWKHTRHWTEADVQAFQAEAPSIAARLQKTRYIHGDGSIKGERLTCEDFAIMVLAEFASEQGLPVALTTGVRRYRNVEVYNPGEHDKYASNKFGFAEMAMLSYGAPDMQRAGINTLKVPDVSQLKPGDILAQAGDRVNNTAHHIQMAVKVSASKLVIKQGNTGGMLFRPMTTIKRWLGKNMADPQNDGYGGLPIEDGVYTKNGETWDYKNETTGNSKKDALKIFEFYRWNFMGFNK